MESKRATQLFFERYTGAISCFDKASSLNSRYLESLHNKGCALQRLDEFEAAIDCFDKAESIRAGLFETLNNKALSLIALGDCTGALTCVDRCISMGLVKSSFYVVRSTCFLALDQIGEGLFDLTISLKLDPQSKHALALLEVFNRAATA